MNRAAFLKRAGLAALGLTVAPRAVAGALERLPAGEIVSADGSVEVAFPEGSWLLAGDGLELGIVRDSVLVRTNSYQIFGEVFERGVIPHDRVELLVA